MNSRKQKLPQWYHSVCGVNIGRYQIRENRLQCHTFWRYFFAGIEKPKVILKRRGSSKECTVQKKEKSPGEQIEPGLFRLLLFSLSIFLAKQCTSVSLSSPFSFPFFREKGREEASFFFLLGTRPPSPTSTFAPSSRRKKTEKIGKATTVVLLPMHLLLEIWGEEKEERGNYEKREERCFLFSFPFCRSFIFLRHRHDPTG